MAYINLLVKIEEGDIKEFLSNFYDEEDLEHMDMREEAKEAVRGVLENSFSDFYVIGNGDIIVGNLDE